MDYHVIIVAGGSGIRLNQALPKQFMELNGRPLLFYTLEKFYQTNPDFRLHLVLPAAHIETWKKLVSNFQFAIQHQLHTGGNTRFHSVQYGLAAISDGLVAVHDGVRPFVSSETINRCFNLASEKGSGIPAIPVSDSVRIIKGDTSQSVNRNTIVLIQTPQCFNVDLLKASYTQPYSERFTDCASVVESSGVPVFLTEGNPENIKITHPADLKFAQALLNF